MEVFVCVFSFISTSELVQSFLTRSHCTHPEHLNNSAGLKGIKTISERLLLSTVWLGSGEMGRKPLQRRALKKKEPGSAQKLIRREYDIHWGLPCSAWVRQICHYFLVYHQSIFWSLSLACQGCIICRTKCEYGSALLAQRSLTWSGAVWDVNPFSLLGLVHQFYLYFTST